ncbi:photosystem II stability/assembly factor-like protein [Echinicola sp. CAU 1574]|uniref:Photosystem II stability/assembly factor-like protein n=1 Tax=Echinicola arenosa TaxID=2774144 RepID=A0ABR9AIR1_9BACT|nr:YCF48-related protein [Echinicola arenosa]MBD8488678.1 photosystem II stability/assembly factor-like protein [Echinicola arenosa]
MRKAYHLLFLLVLSAIAWASCSSPQAVEVRTPLGWKILNTPTKSSLRGLCPLTEEIAWATGSNGLWMLTIDGGLSWDHGVIDGLDTVDFRDIEAFNASTAIAVSAGQPAVIYKTTDSGKTWKRKYEGPEEAFLDGLVFEDDRRGYAYGDPVNGKWMILLTLNGGESWEPLTTAPKAQKGEAGFAASGSGILAKGHRIWMASGGLKSNIYYSEDGGVDWDTIPAPIIQGEPSQGIFSLSFINGKNLVAVGGDYLKPDFNQNNISLSFDEGITWKKPEGTPPSGYRSGVTYFPAYSWLISVGTNGSDYSIDGGNNWTKFSDIGLHAVKRSKNGGAIWASGGEGKVALLNF